MRVADLAFRLTFACAVLVPIGGCRTVTEEVLDGPGNGTVSNVDPQVAFERAQADFASIPREVTTVARAFELAVESARVEHESRYERLVFAATCGLWIAQFGDDEDLRSATAERVVVLMNTAVQLDPERAEGFYYRSIATGLFAQENASYGFDAMTKIRDDARRARTIDPEFDDAGPDRVLGLLYLRAPGAPTGVGSLKRAEFHLRKAYEAFPDRAENPLYLAECAIARDEDDRMVKELLDEAEELIDRAESDRPDGDDPADLEIDEKHLMALRSELAGLRDV